MSSEPASLRDLDRMDRPSWQLRLFPEARGSRLGESRLAVITKHPGARALRIGGLDQAAFEHLVARYGAQFSAIEFLGCQRIADLSPLEDLPGLRLVSWTWNQRAIRLWNMSRTPVLTGLKFIDFIHLHDLDDLRGCAGLEELVFGDGIGAAVNGGKAVFTSLEPLAALENLRYLKFCSRIQDGRIQPLGALTRLRDLWFPVGLFTSRQLAWLRARLPAALQSVTLDPVIPFGEVVTLNGKPKDVRLVGKGKPTLNSLTDQARITKHVDEFWQMVQSFRHDPALDPE